MEEKDLKKISIDNTEEIYTLSTLEGEEKEYRKILEFTNPTTILPTLYSFISSLILFILKSFICSLIFIVSIPWAVSPNKSLIETPIVLEP